MTETKLERWENAVRETPSVAEKFGPPNWLVCESWKKKADGSPAEPFEAAVERVRATYFPTLSKEPVSKVEMSEVYSEVKLRDIVASKVCSDCDKPIEHAGTKCYACQKRRQRDGVAE